MILRSITLSGWRCFSEELTVGPFSDRINIIAGSNGIGKSTIFEALRRGLMDSHAVSGQDILSIRPWGRALSPKVVVCFRHDGIEYRLAKQFIDSTNALLERKENDVFRSIAEGRQANEQARELLSKNAPGRGLSRASHWGVAQVLWAPQGELNLTELSGDLVVDIREMIGVQVTDKAGGPIEQKIFEKYDRYFTGQGRIKTGKAAPPVVSLQKELSEAKDRRTEYLEKMERCEDASRRVEELRSRNRQLSFDAEELEKRVKHERGNADRYKELKAEFNGKKNELDKLQAQHEKLQQHIKMIRKTQENLESEKADLSKLEGKEPFKQKDVDIQQKEAERAKATLETLRKEGGLVEKAGDDAEAARRYNDLRAQREILQRLVRKVTEAKSSLDERKKARAGIVASDVKTLKALRKTIAERDEAKLLMDAAMISLEIVPENDGELAVISGEETGSITLSAGQSTTVKGAPEIVIELKGVGKFTARGPFGDVQTHRQKIRENNRAIGEITQPFGTSEVACLEELADSFQRADRKVGEAEKELEVLLGGEKLDSLEKETNQITTQVESSEKVHPDWKEAPPDYDALKRGAGDARREHERKIAEAQNFRDRTEKAFSSEKEQLQVLSTQIEAGRKSVRSTESTLAELTSDGKSMQEHEGELKLLLLNWDAAKEKLKELEASLEKFGDDPIAGLNKLEKNLVELYESVKNAGREEGKALGTLDELNAQGPYSMLAVAEEEVRRLEEEIEKETLRMEAVKLLYQTVVECRTEAVASVAGPVEEAATRLMHRIAGSRIGRIQMGESFEPAGVSPEMAGASVDIGQLSGGEQEQLYLATRVALAEVLAKDERQMVVLDDVLTATDAGRLARVLNVLEEAAVRLQLLILTCHPERYRGLAEAKLIELESL